MGPVFLCSCGLPFRYVCLTTDTTSIESCGEECIHYHALSALSAAAATLFDLCIVSCHLEPRLKRNADTLRLMLFLFLLTWVDHLV